MGKKTPHKNERYTEAEKKPETHMDVFKRLANVKNMHGHPGVRKPKRS